MYRHYPPLDPNFVRKRVMQANILNLMGFVSVLAGCVYWFYNKHFFFQYAFSAFQIRILALGICFVFIGCAFFEFARWRVRRKLSPSMGFTMLILAGVAFLVRVYW